MTDHIKVGIEFEFPPDSDLHERGHQAVFRDTIWWTEGEYGATITATVLNRMKAGTDAKTNAAKAQRFANFKAAALAPSEEPAPPEEG